MGIQTCKFPPYQSIIHKVDTRCTHHFVFDCCLCSLMSFLYLRKYVSKIHFGLVLMCYSILYLKTTLFSQKLTALGKLGPRQLGPERLGPGQLGPWKVGTRTDVEAQLSVFQVGQLGFSHKNQDRITRMLYLISLNPMLF